MFAISLSLISIKFPVKVTGTNISDFENSRSLGIYGKFEKRVSCTIGVLVIWL